MYSLLTTEGRALVEVARQGSNQIRLQRFSMARIDSSQLPNLQGLGQTEAESVLTPFREAATVEALAQIKWTETAIHYTRQLEDRIVLELPVPGNTGDQVFDWNVILLYGAIADGPEQLLSFHWSTVVNPKLNVLVNKTGMRYYFMLDLIVRDLAKTFDLQNLVLTVPEFGQLDEIGSANLAVRATHDQFVIKRHPTDLTGTQPHFGFVSETQFFGAVMTKPEKADRLPIAHGRFVLMEAYGERQIETLVPVLDAEGQPELDNKGRPLYQRMVDDE